MRALVLLDDGPQLIDIASDVYRVPRLRPMPVWPGDGQFVPIQVDEFSSSGCETEDGVDVWTKGGEPPLSSPRGLALYRRTAEAFANVLVSRRELALSRVYESELARSAAREPLSDFLGTGNLRFVRVERDPSFEHDRNVRFTVRGYGLKAIPPSQEHAAAVYDGVGVRRNMRATHQQVGEECI